MISADFSIAQALCSHPLIKQLIGATKPEERRRLGEIVKTAAALTVAHIGGNKPFESGEAILNRINK